MTPETNVPKRTALAIAAASAALTLAAGVTLGALSGHVGPAPSAPPAPPARPAEAPTAEPAWPSPAQVDLEPAFAARERPRHERRHHHEEEENEHER